jgi:hypothetical protein
MPIARMCRISSRSSGATSRATGCAAKGAARPCAIYRVRMATSPRSMIWCGRWAGSQIALVGGTSHTAVSVATRMMPEVAKTSWPQA